MPSEEWVKQVKSLDNVFCELFGKGINRSRGIVALITKRIIEEKCPSICGALGSKIVECFVRQRIFISKILK